MLKQNHLINNLKHNSNFIRSLTLLDVKHKHLSQFLQIGSIKNVSLKKIQENELTKEKWQRQKLA